MFDCINWIYKINFCMIRLILLISYVLASSNHSNTNGSHYVVTPYNITSGNSSTWDNTSVVTDGDFRSFDTVIIGTLIISSLSVLGSLFVIGFALKENLFSNLGLRYPVYIAFNELFFSGINLANNVYSFVNLKFPEPVF